MDEVGDGVDELGRIALDLQIGLGLDDEVDLAAVRQFPIAFHGIGKDVADVNLLWSHRRLIGLQPGEVDDLRDHLGDSGSLLVEPPGEVSHRLRIIGGTLHGLREDCDGANGGLEFVTDVGDEVPSGLFHAQQRGTIVDDEDDVAVCVQRADAHREVLGSASGGRAGDVDVTAQLR